MRARHTPIRICPRAATSFPGMLLSALLLTAFALPALAQPAADRSAVEEKRKALAAKRALKEQLKKQRTKESAGQREERLREETKDANRKLALKRAQEALQAAARRQNRKGLELMTVAWMLDPRRMDYPFNVAAFAEALKQSELELRAYASFINLAERELGQLGKNAGDYKATIEERMAKANARMQILRNRYTTGTVKLMVVTATNCEIFLDGAFVGETDGKIEAMAGQHKIKSICPGYYDIEQFANVRAGDASTYRLRPVQIPYYGYLVFLVKPNDGVTVFLDDIPVEKRRGKKPDEKGAITGTGIKKDPIALHARKWIIRFKKDGYDRWHRRITINRDQITIVNAVLEKMSDQVEVSGND